MPPASSKIVIFETTQAGLVRGQDVETAAGIVFAIQRKVIFEYKDRQLRRGIRAGLRVDRSPQVCPALIGAPPMPWPQEPAATPSAEQSGAPA